MKRGSTLLAVFAALSLAAAAPASAQTPIRTGIDATFAPHAMPKLGGGLEGFNIDLANELARRMGRPIEIDGTEFSALIPGLNAKKYDFLIAPTTVTPERAKTLLFTEGYMETDYMFLQKKTDKPIASLEDLKGKKVAVNKGSAYESWVRQNADKYGFTFDVYGTNADAVQAVLSGRADTNMAGHTVILWAAKNTPDARADLHLQDRARLGDAVSHRRQGRSRPGLDGHQVHEEGRHDRAPVREVVRHQAGRRLLGLQDRPRPRRARPPRVRPRTRGAEVLLRA